MDFVAERVGVRHSDAALIAARDNYKRVLLVYDRDPREIHKPLLDPVKYALTYAPNPLWCRILEYYCPRCGAMIETEYLPPGHPPVRDIEFDIDALKAQWQRSEEHTSELQSLMRISYAVFCLKKKKMKTTE